MNLIKGTHLTQTHRRGIRLVIQAGKTVGRVGRTDYFVSPPDENGHRKVKIAYRERREATGKMEWRTHNYTIKI